MQWLWIVLAWVLGATLFVYGWALAVVMERRNALYAGLAILGVIICALSAIVGYGRYVFAY